MIEDFGEKIDGAAKDRWRRYRLRLDNVADHAVLQHTLAQVFPEPNYKALLSDGAEPWVISFIRAVRDDIGAKPGNGRGRAQQQWASQVIKMRRFTTELLDGKYSPEALKVAIVANTSDRSALLARMRAYEVLGHERSLKGYKIRNAEVSSAKGVRYDPPRAMWVVENTKERFFSVQEDLDDALTELQAHLAASPDKNAAKGPQRKHFQIYSYKHKPGRFYIGRKLNGRFLDVMSFVSGREAAAFLQDHFDQVAARYEALRQTPKDRAENNAAREGKDYRGGRDISPGEFSATFGFRGVQFGNYVEGPRRQMDLNRAYDALMDLSSVLGCAPSALSLDGKLGLAFGARGTGGRNAAAAHYEPLQVVINLTKGNGAGSLAHEWFHALDNMVGRKTGAATAMATGLAPGRSANLTFEDRAPVEALARLGNQLRSAPVSSRCRTADRYRSSPYYSLPEEISARAFESWVIDRLARKGGRNDYLANIQDEEVFAAEAKLYDLPDSRYPYPCKSELEDISRMFEAAFVNDGAIAQLLGGLALEDLQHAPSSRAGAASEEAEIRQGRFLLDEDEEIEFG